MVAFNLRTCEMCRDHVAVGKRMKSADRVLECSRIVFTLPPLLQSWTARSQGTSRTASGRFCPAGRTATASRRPCHIAVTLATTCWAPAPSPVRGTAPGIAPCPSACVSLASKRCPFISHFKRPDHNFRSLPFGQWCSATGPACPPTPRSQATVGRWDRSSATAASASAPSLATQPECASWTASGAAHRRTVLVRRTQIDCVWAERDNLKTTLLPLSSFF